MMFTIQMSGKEGGEGERKLNDENGNKEFEFRFVSVANFPSNPFPIASHRI